MTYVTGTLLHTRSPSPGARRSPRGLQGARLRPCSPVQLPLFAECSSVNGRPSFGCRGWRTLSAALPLWLLLFGWASYLLGALPGPTLPTNIDARYKPQMEPSSNWTGTRWGFRSHTRGNSLPIMLLGFPVGTIVFLTRQSISDVTLRFCRQLNHHKYGKMGGA